MSARFAPIADYLAAGLGGLDEVGLVLPVPPPSNAAMLRDGVTVALSPPARTTVRNPGQARITWRTELWVFAPLDSRNLVVATERVTDAVAAIDGLLDADLTLGGLVTTTEPVSWEMGQAQDWPESSGVWFCVQTGTLPMLMHRDLG